MPEFGLMGVDWEERVDNDRLRKDRLRKAKEAMDSSDLDVMFVFRLEDVRYITGYRSHLGPVTKLDMGMAVLPKGGDPILFTLDQHHARERMPWIPGTDVYRRPNIRHAGGALKLAETIQKRLGSLSGKKIGVDAWPMSTDLAMRQAFPKAEFCDGYEVLAKAKMFKTKDEIECLKAAYAITEAGMDAALRILKPGVKECELLATAWYTFTALGSEWTQCANIVTSGPSTAPYRRITSDRIIKEGDLVILDIGGCFNGYWGDLTRTWVCGDIMPTKEQIELHQECYNAVFNACGKCRVGNTNKDVVAQIQTPNNWDMSGGHSAGTSPWEPPYLSDVTPDAIFKMQPGMVFNIEPYAGQPGIGGFRLENNVIVTETEPEIFTTYPFDERLVKDVHPLDKSTGRVREFRQRYK